MHGRELLRHQGHGLRRPRDRSQPGARADRERLPQSQGKEARSRSTRPLPRNRPATDNPDAEPIPSCESAKPAIIVYPRNIGTSLTACTHEDCPVHDPLAEKKRQAAEERVQAEAETVSPEPIEPTEEEKQE